MLSSLQKNFRLRSFVRRDGRMTAAQRRAYTEQWPRWGLSLEQGLLNETQVFGRTAPCLLEIGFGNGQSLLAAALAYPELNFIGVETHQPGIGSVLLGINAHALTNVRVYNADAIDVLEKALPDASLAGIQLFFPDPWQKRRHHARRLIQAALVNQLADKLIPGGSLHLATDWEDYAKHMHQVLAQEKKLMNLAAPHAFAERSCYRPILSKFERRALREGRQIWELQFARC